MDIINSCCKQIDEKIEELDQLIEVQRSKESDNEYTQTQTIINSMSNDKDKNLDRILDQQAYLKMIIETDGRIVSLNKHITHNAISIENLRKNCANLEREGLKARQQLLEEQAKELERFQMQQLKSISDDYKRHQEILEVRKKELATIKREIEKEESGREAYLISYAKDCDKTLQSRKQLKQLQFCALATDSSDPTNELNDPNYLELETVNEYAPYGPAPNSRLSSANNSRRGGSTRSRRSRGSRGGRQL